MTEQTPQEQLERSGKDMHDICSEASDVMRIFFRRLGPSNEVINYFRQSQIDFLKGVRQLIDECIDRTEQPNRKGTKVTVE